MCNYVKYLEQRHIKKREIEFGSLFSIKFSEAPGALVEAEGSFKIALHQTSSLPVFLN